MSAKANHATSRSSRARQKRLALPAGLSELRQRYRGLTEGQVADYIPELARAHPDWFAISVVTTDGQVHSFGDFDQRFTIQSISKPFIYGLALEDHGHEAVLERVGVEPTGDAFNSIIKLDAANRPHNPCVNAGAIATTSLIRGADPTTRLNRVLAMFRKYAGHTLDVDMSVFMSERTTGHRNRAIAYLMLNFGMIEPNVEQILDLYFQQCSILVSCRDLAVMAGTLANGGVNPVTGERAVDAAYIRDILTVMYTCGTYDYAGHWAYSVGLPAKSGVTGGIIAVVPGRLGIAVYSPPVDKRGNSVRGIRVCEDLSRDFGMHLFDPYVQGQGEDGQKHNTDRSERGDSDNRVQDPAQISHVLRRLHKKYKDNRDGAVTTYIPELAKVDPELFGISVVTVDGAQYGVGDTEVAFTIQSIANPFVYGLVLDDLGREHVNQTVGVEPTGNPFNAIVLDRETNRPMNPMVNAGAIAVAGLVDGADPTARLNRMLEMFGRYIGATPTVNMEVFLSERTTSDRNRSIAYLMRNFNVLRRDIDETLDLYIQQCAVNVTTSRLAMMAATLANGGVHPRTGTRAISPQSLRDVLTIMYTCGLYETSGQWIHQVGIPAKSGVSGGLLAVVPGRMGIAIYSPRVDSSGTSVRGKLACTDISQSLDLHILQHPAGSIRLPLE